MINQIVSAVFSFEFDEQLDLLGDEGVCIRETVVDVIDPVRNMVQSIRTVQVRFRDNAHWRSLANEVQPTLGMNVRRPSWRKVFWS
jgi:hypothetical protein